MAVPRKLIETEVASPRLHRDNSAPVARLLAELLENLQATLVDTRQFYGIERVPYLRDATTRDRKPFLLLREADRLKASSAWWRGNSDKISTFRANLCKLKGISISRRFKL